MTNFRPFADQTHAQFNTLQQAPHLFVVDATGDELYAAYLAAFPEGTNPLYRTRSEHECSNCRGFIRNFGGVIAIDPVTLDVQTVWDGEHEAPYDAVAAALRAFVASRAIGGLFRVSQPSFSAQKTVSVVKDTLVTETFHHFYGVAQPQFVTQDGAQVGEHATSVQVLRDSFDRLRLSAVDTVLELIRDRQVYRGEEHEGKVRAFRAALVRHAELSPEQQGRFIALTAPNLAVSRFKNSAIGTLVEGLSEGADVEAAVRAFEAMVAPQNYQRTNQVVTQRMVDAALKTIADLGVPVERRLARLDDISVTNVLWVSGASRPLMKDGLAGLLAGAVTVKPVALDERQITEVGIDAFLQEVLPGAQGLRLLVEPGLVNNFMTLTTAVQAGGRPLFKWNNPFAWSYTGGTTDMIQERVKAAGGNIAAALRYSLSWSNFDDLDLHVHYANRPGYRDHIYYGSRTALAPGLIGGLDVDMNAGGPRSRTPVENIAFTRLAPGTYQVSVRNFAKRENQDVGFTLQVADAQGVRDYRYREGLAHGAETLCLSTTVDAAGNITHEVLSPVLQRVAAQAASGEKWGVPLGAYAEVQCVMLSPNHWDGQATGNRHTFFILGDAKADERPRGIYNEYLHPDLVAHRKVFDVIGERTRPQLEGEQLSGVGVSSTLDKTVVVEVTTTSSKRAYRIQF